jgi:hypothetical protein
MMSLCISPQWVQAGAESALTVLTLLTLIVLKGYADDTKIIAKESVAQTENAQRPFLTLVLCEGRVGIVNGWNIQNQGFGPALNIRYTLPDGQAQITRSITALAVGGVQSYNVDIDNALQQGVTIDYDSLSGLRYRTVVNGPRAQPVTSFGRA